MHCLVALEAMKHGKAVYVQKPLCNTLQETRLLTEDARRRGLTTQMGIQVSSSRSQRYGEALVRSGIVGKIREVHTFSNKSWGDDKPLPDAERSGAGPARLGRVARRQRDASIQEGRAITRASGAGASDSGQARSATWAATSTVRRIAR